MVISSQNILSNFVTMKKNNLVKSNGDAINLDNCVELDFAFAKYVCNVRKKVMQKQEEQLLKKSFL